MNVKVIYESTSESSVNRRKEMKFRYIILHHSILLMHIETYFKLSKIKIIHRPIKLINRKNTMNLKVDIHNDNLKIHFDIQQRCLGHLCESKFRFQIHLIDILKNN